MTTEDEKLEAAFGGMLEKLSKGVVIDLTDEEWMSIIVRERDGLSACCGNISSLRDVLISIARDNGDVNFMHRTALAQRISWCFPSHDVPSGAMQKILDQLEYSHPDVERHIPDKLEF